MTPTGVPARAKAAKPRTTKASSGQPKFRPGVIVELVVILAAAIALALGVQAFVVKPYRIPSGSMEPTLAIGQRVLVNRLSVHISSPHVGEIAVFHPPASAEQQECGGVPHTVKFGGAACSQAVAQEASVNFVKRIVAGPGDEIYIKEGHVYRKAAGSSSFVAEHDPYIKPCDASPECDFPIPIKIPPGHWFMMGDNRGNSDDSRFWGPVPTSWIIGEALITYWPPDRIGTF